MRSLEAALMVFKEFCDSGARRTVRDLCTQTQLSKSQVSKILADFRRSGFLVQDPQSREYSVGLLAVKLAGQYLKNNALTREALGPMRRLVDRTQHTATLCVLNDVEIVYLLSVESPLFIDHGWRAGAWLPAHATAAGKVLAAFQPDSEFERIVAAKGLKRFTPSTVCDMATLRTQFRQIRKRGVAITHSEGTPGLGAQAVPVFGEGQAVLGALGLVYPDHLGSPLDRNGLTQALYDAARHLSHRMGARVYPFGSATPMARQTGALLVF